MSENVTQIIVTNVLPNVIDVTEQANSLTPAVYIGVPVFIQPTAPVTDAPKYLWLDTSTNPATAIYEDGT